MWPSSEYRSRKDVFPGQDAGLSVVGEHLKGSGLVDWQEAIKVLEGMKDIDIPRSGNTRLPHLNMTS